MTLPSNKQEMIDYIMSYFEENNPDYHSETYFSVCFPNFANGDRKLESRSEGCHSDKYEYAEFSIGNGPRLSVGLFVGSCTGCGGSVFYKEDNGETIREILLYELHEGLYFNTKEEEDLYMSERTRMHSVSPKSSVNPPDF